MRVGIASGRQEMPGGGSRPDRRAFLRVGAGCALPLMAGVLSEGRGMAASVVPGQEPTGQDSTELVLTYAQEELARTYHAMRGPAGIRGEHVRSLAANLELTGVCLESSRAAARVEAAIRRRLAEHGRDATIQDGLTAYNGLLEDLAAQHGVVPGRSPEAARLAAMLDAVAADGLRLHLRAHRARLNRLATERDRIGAVRGAKASPMLVRQKPGDDFLGYPEISPGAGMTLCEFLMMLQMYFELVAVALALGGLELPGGVLAMLGIMVGVLEMQPCRQNA
jgi:hypothetical protein